jgi:hypothetical protein
MKKLLLILLCFPFIGLAQQTVGVFSNLPESYNGYTLFNSSGSKTTYLIDNCGYKVYQWDSNFKPGLMVYLLDNGNLLRTNRLNNTTLVGGGSGGGIEILDTSSNVLWSYIVNSDSTLQHHDVEVLPNGNVLILAWELISEQEANSFGSVVSADRYSEMILEVNPSTDQIVWEWHAWDHLIQDIDPNLPHYGSISDYPEGEMAFAEVELLPYPLNSASDELGIVFKGMANSGVFSSNRPGGKGQDDLYSFRLPPMEFCYNAYIYDYDTGMPVGGATITLESSEGEINSYSSDGDGSISLCDGEIGEGVTYDVDVKNEGFIGTGDRFSSIGLTESTTFAREYFLKEIFLEKEYPMPLVLYPLASADLLIDESVNSADSLNYLVDLLTRNENLVIQLEAHTDSRGTSSSNKTLSQRRAETCVDFLVGKGISADRIVPMGHGEDYLKISDRGSS